MKKTLTMLLIACCIANLYSQDKIHEFELIISVSPNNNFVYRDLEYDPIAQKLSIYGQNYQPAMLFANKEEKKTSFSSGIDYIPFVYVAHLSTGAPNDVVEKAINLKDLPRFKMGGKKYEAKDPKTIKTISSSETATSLDELLASYPKAFPSTTHGVNLYEMSIHSKFNGFYISEKLQPYEFKEEQSNLIKKNSTIKVLKPELGKDFKVFVEKNNVVDNKRRLAMVPTLLGLKGDKLHGFKNKRFYTIDRNAAIANQVDVVFEFPKSLAFASGLGVSAIDSISNFEDGVILIYNRAFGVGKKSNDPDKTRYNVVILNKDGALDYEGVFHFGNEKKSFSPYHAVKIGKNVHVFGKVIANASPGYAVLTFDGESGLVDTKEYAGDDFSSKAIGNYKSGLTTNYSRGFKPVTHYVLGNGDVLIHGESFDKTTETTERLNPAGGSTGSMIRTDIYTYLAHVFLHIDKDGNLINEYIAPKTSEDSKKKITRFSKLVEKNNAIYLQSEEKEGQSTYGVILKLDYKTKSIVKTNLSNFDVFDLRGDVVSKFDSDASQIIFLGRTADKDNFTAKSVVFNLD